MNPDLSSKPPLVSVILLNWNSKDDTLSCVQSIKKSSYKNYEIIIVDNASSGNSVEFLKRNLREITMIQNKTNLGLSKAWNNSIRQCKGKYIALLNSDTIVHKNWLSELVGSLEKDKSLAIIGSKIINKGSYYLGTSTGNIVNIFTDIVEEPQNPKEAFFVSTCACLFRRNFAGETPFDSDYFADYEDVYLSWLMQLKGYKLEINPEAEITHLCQKSEIKYNTSKIKANSKQLTEYEKNIIQNRAFRKFLDFDKEKNKYLNLFLFYQGRTLLKIFPLILINMLLSLLVAIYKRNFLNRLKSYLWLLANIDIILKKRKPIQQSRKIPDKKILSMMSCKFGFRIFGLEHILNGFACLYCWTLRIKTREFSKLNTSP